MDNELSSEQGSSLPGNDDGGILTLEILRSLRSILAYFENGSSFFDRLRFRTNQGTIINGARAIDPQAGEDGFDGETGSDGGTGVAWFADGVCCGCKVAVAMASRFMSIPASP